MINAQAQLQRLRDLCPAAELWPEGNAHLAFLPGIRFKTGGSESQCDLLLWPFERDGYSSRLFLSAPVPSSTSRAWTAYNIQGRTWHAVSWQGVPNNLPWIEMVGSHLQAFQ